jgi:putative aldouronate transport system substrate-binding protein
MDKNKEVSMRRLFSILLVVTLVLSFSACASQDEPAETTGTQAATTTAATTTKSAATTTAATTTAAATTVEVEENPFEEFFEISWLTQYGDRHVDGRWDEAELEELFNVDIQVWHYNSLTAEQMAALVAAGDIPDFFFMPGAPRQPHEMYEEKLIRSVPLEFLKKYLPGQYRLMEAMPIGFQYNLVPGKTDEYLDLTHIGMSSAQYFYEATAINLDWLENIGYEPDMSNFKSVKMLTEGYEHLDDQVFVGEYDLTFEDLNEILRAFTEDDPDGNGEDDTVGMMYLSENAWTNLIQEGLFGFVHDLNYLYEDPVSGDVVPKYAYTPYRDYLAWVSEMITKGYFGRLPGQQSWSLEYYAATATNKVGIMQVHRNAYMMPSNDTYAVQPPINILLEADPNARFLVGILFQGPNGPTTGYTYAIDAYGVGKSRVDMFGIQVTDEKMARILQILEYTTFSSYDNYLKFKSGLEGVHWKWAGEPYLSPRITTPEADLPPEYRGWPSTFSLWVSWSEADESTKIAEATGYWDFPKYAYAYNLYEKYACIPKKYISAVYMGQEMYDEYMEKYNALFPAIRTVINDFKNRALNGAIADFNSEWVQYIDQIYAAGLGELIKDYYNNPDYKDYDPGDKFKIRGRI